MKIRLVAVGTLSKDRALRALVDDYLGRVRRHCRCEEVELRPGPPAKLAQAIAQATRDAVTVAFEVDGEVLTSPQLAGRLERLASRGKGVVAFLIGGADGLPREASAQADERWSLSALTFPHRLARVMVAEQLYRALSILKGTPYNH